MNKQGIVLDMGQAPYKHDPANNNSFFIRLRDEKGVETEQWGIGLKQAAELSQIRVGDQVVLQDKGMIEGSKQRAWAIEKQEPVIEYANSIEPDLSKTVERDPVDMTKEPQQQKITPDYEESLPESIRNNYIYRIKNPSKESEFIRFYDKENTQDVAFEARQNGLHTSRQDERTIHAMLDMAESKGWSAISLKGTEEFKQKAWLEATLRGIESRGYQPTELDFAKLEAAKEQRTHNSVQVDQVKSTESTELEQAKQVADQPVQQPEPEPEPKPEPVATVVAGQEAEFSEMPISEHEMNVAPVYDYDPFDDPSLQSDHDPFLDDFEQSANPASSFHEYDQGKPDNTIDLHQAYVDEAINTKQDYYQTPAFIRDFSASYKNGKTSEVFSDQYFNLDKFTDARLISVVEQDVSSDPVSLDHAVISSSNGRFVRQTLADLVQHLPDNVKAEIMNKHDHRANFAFEWSSDKENVSLKSIVVPVRQDLSITLANHDIADKESILKDFDHRMIDYTKQVVAFQKTHFSDKQHDEAIDLDAIESEKIVHVINAIRDEVPQQEAVSVQSGIQHLRVVLDEYKDHLNENTLVTIDHAKKAMMEATKNHPAIQDKRLHELANGIVSSLERGQTFDVLTVINQPSVEIQTGRQGNQDRGR